jgi:putative FmdB family regulatory protein
MPTYDYECDGCGHTFELFQSIMAEPEKKCPKCAKKKLRRLIGTGAAVMFKGSGFYQTDYRSESYKKSAASDKKSTDAGGDTKSSETTKPETKTETKSEPSATPAPKASSDSKPAPRKKKE